jgi:hypothetical protein
MAKPIELCNFGIRRVNVEVMKMEIEHKYLSMINDEIGELSPEDIRDVFSEFVIDSESFNKLTDQEIIEFYKKWYRDSVITLQKLHSDIIFPDIED